MGDRRSKEDDVLKISTSIYVTNFPEHINAKELWRSCSQCGNVIDTFIPNRRSKISKRFGFVCFIKTSDVDRLVNNLCTIWIGHFKLHVNVARFNKQPMHKAFKTGINSHNVVEYSKPSLVLDESCFHNYDFFLSLVGKLKEFGSLPNLKKILEEEGFSDINIRYMGEFWVMFQFHSKAAQDNFKSHVGINSWLSSIQQASYSFSINEMVAWIDIEGVPLSVWSRNTFARISSKWASLLYEEDEDARYFHRKRLCIKTTTNENIFDSFKIIVKGKIFWIRVKEVTGWAPDFSNSHDDSSESDDESVEAKSKDVYSEKVSEAEEIPETIFEVEEPGEIKFSATKENKSEDLEEVQSDDPFNLYDLLEKNNQTSMLQFNQKGSQSIRRGSHLVILQILILLELIIRYMIHQKRSMVLRQVFRRMHALGFVQDINMFHKENSTVSDYFIAIIGKWLPNDKNLLIISVYAPQELSEKRMLWQYLVYVIEGWKGDVIVMGDFNEVRTTKERFGSIFNARGAAAFNSLISTGGLVEILIVRDRFDTPCKYRLTLDMNFPNKLSTDQMYDLERPFLKRKIRRSGVGCGVLIIRSDGFNFGFYRKFWSLIEEGVVADVNQFLHNGYCEKGGNSSFIALIPKSPGSKMVKDF
ncbi:RNA-directed DNA polymerase, eukaryota [Tanacetum coccineum]